MMAGRTAGGGDAPADDLEGLTPEELRQELRRTREALQLMAHAVSHDLGEPCRKVVQFGTLVEERAGDALTGDSRRHLGYMVKAGRRMQAMLAGMLAWSRVTTAASPFERTPLQALVERALDKRRARMQELSGAVEHAVDGEAEVDGGQIETVVLALVDNSLRFIAEGDTPSLRIRSEQATLPGPDPEGDRPAVRLVFEDDGIGFEPRFAESIFVPYRRLHTRSEYPGVGMGLAICHRIADRHGGSLSCLGVPGGGATFLLTLPRDQQRRGGAQ